MALGSAAGYLAGALVIVTASASLFGILFFSWLQYRGLPAVATRLQLRQSLQAAEATLATLRSQAAHLEKTAERLRRNPPRKPQPSSATCKRSSKPKHESSMPSGRKARANSPRSLASGEPPWITKPPLSREYGRISAGNLGRDNKLAELARNEAAELSTALQALQRDAINAF